MKKKKIRNSGSHQSPPTKGIIAGEIIWISKLMRRIKVPTVKGTPGI